MPDLWLYDKLSRARWLNYRAKIMLIAFLGTHIPLLAIITYFVMIEFNDLHAALVVIGVALVATLLGTVATLLVLNGLLRPIVWTSEGLRSYRDRRQVPDLPTHYTDEVGTLMADAKHTLSALDFAIDEMANYDKVTGLPNRDRFLAFLNERMSGEKRFAVCALRLGNYDRLTSTFDQTTADEVLRSIANRLVGHVGPAAFVARIEAGLFAFVADGDLDLGVLAARVERTLAIVSAELSVGSVQVLPEVQSGLALFPDDARSAEALLDDAVGALGGVEDANLPGSLNFFSPTTREAARARFTTEQELRHALAGDELRLHFQPVVDMSLGRVVGAEALVRWQHPEKGLVYPGAFIPVAEASGLIDRIDRWVLQAACAQVTQWSQEGVDEIKVAVNLSARQFSDSALIETIRRTLDDNRVSADRIEIELTETAAMSDAARTRRAFEQLRDLGVSVAIDDFGTGYSSMSYLRSLPFDKLKIDREFVTDVHRLHNSKAICEAIVALTRGLEISVLAEGTEAPEEVRELYGLGCRLFQGYYFAKPLAPALFRDTVLAGEISGRIASAMAGVLQSKATETSGQNIRHTA